MNLSKILTSTFLIVCCTYLTAQDTTPVDIEVFNFDRLDYNAGTQNWAAIQDSSGVLYFGNNKGLLEFDGTNWICAPLRNGTIVRSLAHGSDSCLYIGSQNEFGYRHIDSLGRADYHSLRHLIPDSAFSFEDVWRILSVGEKIYFCSEKAVFIYSASTSMLEVLEPDGKRFENFFSTRHGVRFQMAGMGLYRLGENGLTLLSDHPVFKNDRVVAILPYDINREIIFTVTGGAYTWNESDLNALTGAGWTDISAGSPYCAIQTSEGVYAVGTAQDGLYITDKNGDIQTHINQENGLQNNTVLCIHEDSHANLWLGMDNGIDYALTHSAYTRIGANMGVNGTGYTSLWMDDKLYLGTNQGVYVTTLEKGNPEGFLPFRPVSGTLGQVWSLNLIDGKPMVSQHKGVQRIVDYIAEPFSTEQGAWKIVELQNHAGYALEGTYQGFIIHRKGKEIGSYSQGDHWRLPNFTESARVFEEDSDGSIWVSHAYKGLYRISLTQDLSEIAQIKDYGEKDGLPGELFVNVAKIRGEIVFTTPRGVFIFSGSNQRFEEHKDLTEIFGSGRDVHRLIEDDFGNIWFSIDDEFGVLQVAAQGIYNKLKIRYFNQLHDELVDGFEHVFAVSPSFVLIGMEQGFVKVDLNDTAEDNTSIEVLIRRVTSITERDSVIYAGGIQHIVPTFGADLNDFRFSISAPYYAHLNHIQYRMKLDGFDQDWAEWSPKTEKEYTNLSAGSYTFMVQARNAYGQVSEAAIYNFRVRPPWYNSGLARAFYFIVSLIVVSGIFIFVNKKEKRKTLAFKKAQMAEMDEKKAEFKEEVTRSEKEVVMLRNEKLQADIGHKTSRLASTTMHLVQKSEILMKIKTDLNDILPEANNDLKRKISQIARTIESDIMLDNSWEQFEIYFDQVHENFFKRLRQKYPEITPKDQRLCAYLRMNLSTKEIAPLLNISVRGVEISRYRLRKKIGLASDTNLIAFVMDI